MSTQKTNPSHGTKVTSDPLAKIDQKAENAGPITKDSLAAESLSSDGSFSSGNPAGIQSVSADNNTFNAEGGNATVLKGGKPETRTQDMIGRADEDVKSRSGVTGTAGGGKQAQYAFNDESRDSRGESAIDDLRSASARGSSHTGGSAQDQAQVGKKPSASTGTIGKGGEDVDWSQIPNETRPTTNIGSEEDPARLAEQHMINSATRQGPMTTGRHAEGGNTFDVLDNETQS